MTTASTERTAAAPGVRRSLPDPRVWFLLLVLAAGITGSQVFIHRSFQRRTVENLLYLPNGRFLKTAVLGFDGLAADYYWLRTIGYFGGHFMKDKNYPWLAHILNLVTDLDPRYNIAYYFGGVVLALEANQVDESIALLEKGMRNLPDRWKLPFFIGFNYFYYKGDLGQAARYISRAATLPGAPEYMPRLAATLYAKSGRPEDAVRFLEGVMATLDDERLRAGLEDKIERLRRGEYPQGLEDLYRQEGRTPPTGGAS